MKSIARNYIPIAHPVFAGREKEYVNECLDTVWISSAGHFIGDFERAFENRFGYKHAVTTNNGTTALHLVLTALRLGPGDEVIVPTMTYIASANAVVYCGARPVFVDSEPVTYNIDPERIEAAITPRTKGIMVVHLYGHPADMNPILKIARKHGLFVVEDAAEALGAQYRGHNVGTLGVAGTYSFFGNKVITTGEGGMVVTDDEGLNERLRLLRGQGMDPARRYWFPIVGFNYRMTNIEAAIGLAQLECFDLHLGRHRQVAKWYDEGFASCPELIERPVEQPWARHSYWIYTVVLGDEVKCTRDEMIGALHARSIETRPAFYPMHVMPPYQGTFGTFPVAEKFGERGLSLPTHGLLTAEDVAYVVSQVRDLAGKS